MGFALAAAVSTGVLVAGCARTMEAPQLERVLGVVAPSFRLGVESNPVFERVDDRTLRVVVTTTHQCAIDRPDTGTSIDGSTAVVQLWEFRGPCDVGASALREHLAVHEVELAFESGGEVQVVLWNRVPAYGFIARDVWTIDLDSDDAPASLEGES